MTSCYCVISNEMLVFVLFQYVLDLYYFYWVRDIGRRENIFQQRWEKNFMNEKTSKYFLSSKLRFTVQISLKDHHKIIWIRSV